jgi:hypothetical protein
MLAIALYSPTDTERKKVKTWFASQEWYQPFKEPYANAYRWTVRPYVLLTSQWQRWNLFSPDPLRRVTNVSIEQLQNRTWQDVVVLEGGSMPWYRQAKELKLAGRIDSSYQEDEFKEQYLQNVCRYQSLPTKTKVRWRKNYYVIPKNEPLHTADFWHNYEPDVTSEVLYETTCTKPLTS